MTENMKASEKVQWRGPREWWPWVRRFRNSDGRVNRGWFWTPLTYRFGHGGWIYLNLAWLWRFRNGS